MTAPVLHIRAVSAMTPGWMGVNGGIPAAPVPDMGTWFDATAHLGRKGHRYLSHPTKYALAAAQRIGDAIRGGADAALYLGTGSADTEHRRQIVRGLNGCPDVLPGAASAPSASVNGPAGTLARIFGITGPVMTLTGGDDSALICLWQAATAMARGDVGACVIGQVEHVPGSADGAVLWSLDLEHGDSAVAEIVFDGWSRLQGDADTALLREIAAIAGEVTLIAADTPQLRALIRPLQHARCAFEFMPASTLSDVLIADMHLFSLLTLAILNGTGGSILILSGNGHLFKLSCKPRGLNNA
ncbi:hypothetical protein SAMN06273572_1077 [Monaibacterium marinum]|uniref:Beta-ketoacyl synthase-like N-terminal domain-containing protein n=1 Tax=Pontivivens marinum TaxID=1690039 RepID=A0A2C9CUE4_9RHOB|nr:beta-ketoacyl synthase N-terminal-like domain-containing protein [Monaibacterium marinum]SOH94986.1 hypothetical protein SAMN06273572_1077 [Monaibacterium marinum]